MMEIPTLHEASHEEFEKADGINRIIVLCPTNYRFYFILNDRKYYIGYFSPLIKPEIVILKKENYLLIGVDLKVVALCMTTGSVLFMIGLFSFFKRFGEVDDPITFTIYTELENIKINKKGLSISQIIPHELEF